MSEVTEEQIEEVGEQIKDVVEKLAEIDEEVLSEFRSRISRYETVGPLLNPTAYRDGKGQQAEMAKRRAKAVQSALNQLKDEDLTLANITKNAVNLDE